MSLIETDPHADGVRKFTTFTTPIQMNSYNGGKWVITYRIADWVIEIFGIRRME